MLGAQCSRALEEQTQEDMFSSLFYNLTFINPADRGDIFCARGNLRESKYVQFDDDQSTFRKTESLLSYIGLTEHYQVHRELRGSRLKPGMT